MQFLQCGRNWSPQSQVVERLRQDYKRVKDAAVVGCDQ